MIDILTTLASVSAWTWIGYGLIHVFDLKKQLFTIEKCALGYGLGLGLLAWVMLWFQLGGIRFTRTHLGAVLMALTLVLLLAIPLRRRQQGKSKREPYAGRLQQPGEPSLRGWDYFFLICIGFELIHTFFRTWIRPMEAYDAVSNWGLKAKAIYAAHQIPVSFLQIPDYQVFHPDYPLLVPLIESSIYEFLGHLNDTASKTLFPLFLAACLVLFWVCLRRASFSQRHALAFTFMLATVPYFTSQATNGYADIVVSFYFGISSLYLYLWYRGGSGLFLLIAALLSGLAGLTKNEGIVLSLVQLIVLGAVLVRKRNAALDRFRMQHFLAYAGLLVVVLLPWFLFKAGLNFSNDVAEGATFHWNHLQRLGPILYFYQAQIFGLRNWNLIWVLFLGALIWKWPEWRRSLAMPLILTVALVMAAQMGIYLVTPRDPAWHLRASASRLMLHILPQVAFLIALASGGREPKK